jgi:hypothetical protein
MDQPAGTPLPNISDSGPHGAAPELSVAADGTIYFVWQGLGEKVNEYYKPAIKFVKSIDGGKSFSLPRVVARDITIMDDLPYNNGLPITNGWPHFPGATFRVITNPTGCTGSGNNVISAWADAREKGNTGQPISRIYY